MMRGTTSTEEEGVELIRECGRARCVRLFFANIIFLYLLLHSLRNDIRHSWKCDMTVFFDPFIDQNGINRSHISYTYLYLVKRRHGDERRG